MNEQTPAPVDERLLVDYADGTLDAEQAEAVEAQLAASPEYRPVVDAYRASLETMRSGLRNPPETKTVPLADIVRRARTLRVRRRVVAPIAGLATACAIVGLVWAGLYAPRQAPVETAAQAELEILYERIAELERGIAALKVAVEAQATREVPIYSAQMQNEQAAAIVMAAGLHMEQERKNIAVALSRYHDVLTYFPNTHAATSARERIQALGSSTI